MAGTTPSDTNLLIAQIDALRLHGNTDAQERLAAHMVHRYAADGADERQLLEALGLPAPSHGRVYRKQDCTLGHKPEAVA